jgi:hypothetical protein
LAQGIHIEQVPNLYTNWGAGNRIGNRIKVRQKLNGGICEKVKNKNGNKKGGKAPSPVQMKRVLHVKVAQLHSAVLLQGPVHVPQLTVDQGEGGPVNQHFRQVCNGQKVIRHRPKKGTNIVNIFTESNGGQN